MLGDSMRVMIRVQRGRCRLLCRLRQSEATTGGEAQWMFPQIQCKDTIVTAAMKMPVYSETVGSGSPSLVLLHGLGQNGAVWRPLLAELSGWPGRIVIPDLRGHGRSPHARH